MIFSGHVPLCALFPAFFEYTVGVRPREEHVGDAEYVKEKDNGGLDDETVHVGVSSLRFQRVARVHIRQLTSYTSRSLADGIA